MSTFDDPNREAVGLEPIWTGAEARDVPDAPPPPPPPPPPEPVPAQGGYSTEG